MPSSHASSSSSDYSGVSGSTVSSSVRQWDEELDVGGLRQLTVRTYQLYGFATWDKKTHSRAVSIVIAVIEFLQLLALSFVTPLSSAWGDADVGFTWLSVFINIGEGHISFEVHLALFWLSIVVFLLHSAVTQSVGNRLAFGEEQWTAMATWLRRSFLVYEMVTFWMLSVMLASLSCTRTGQVLLRFPNQPCFDPLPLSHLVIGVTFILVLVSMGAMNALMNLPIFPEKEVIFSLADHRIRGALFGWKCALLIFSEIISAMDAGIGGTLVYVLLLLGSHLGILAFIVFRIPYHKTGANQGVFAAISISFGVAASRSILTLMGTTSSVGIYVGFAAGAVLAVLGYFAIKLRLRVINAKAEAFLTGQSKQSVAIMSSPNGIETPFERDFEIEICTRAMFIDRHDEDADEALGQLFAHGTSVFPDSVDIRMAHAIYMLSRHDDYQWVQILVTRARRMNPSWLETYKLYRIDKRRADLTALQDGGQAEISARLTRAMKYQEECRRHIRTFWSRLVKDEDLNTLPEIVSAIDLNEKRAEDVYRRLTLMYPKSPQVLRAYGVFLDEIKSDPELAQMAFRSADGLEDQKTRAHKHKLLRKKAAADKEADAKKVSPVKAQHKQKKTDKTAPKPTIAAAKDANSSETKGQAGTSVRFRSLDELPAEALVSSRKTDYAEQSGDDTDAEISDHEFGVDLETDLHTGGPIVSKLTKTKTQQHIREARQMRSEFIRHRKYRQRIERSKSTAVKGLTASIFITMVILLIDLVLVYTASMILFSIFTQSVDTVVSASELRYQVAQSATQLHHMFQAASKGDVAVVDWYRTALVNLFTKFGADLRTLYALDLSKSVHYMWNTPVVPRIDFTPAVGNKSWSFSASIVNVWDLSMQYAQAGLAVAKMSMNDLAHGSDLVPSRLVLDNGFTILFPAYDLGTDAYAAYSEAVDKQLEVMLIAVLTVSVVGLALLAILVFMPTVRRISVERMTAIRLFTAIPHVTLQQIYDHVSGRDKEGDDNVKDQEEETYQEEMAVMDGDSPVGDNDSMPILRKLIVRYFIVLGVVLLFVGLLMAVGFIFVSLGAAAGPQVDEAGVRQGLVKRVQFLCEELLDPDPFTFKGGKTQVRGLMLNITGELLATQFALKYGSAELRLPSTMIDAPEQQELLYDRPCHLYDPNQICFGLDTLINRFVQASRLVAKLPDDQLSANNTNVAELLFLAGEDFVSSSTSPYSGELEKFLRESGKLYHQRSSDRLKFLQNALTVVFACSLPVLLIAFLVLQPVRKMIAEENTRTMRMLLMIPIDVIDNVPAIREYLDSGRQDSAQERLKDALEQSVARNTAIISASVDGIIVMNAGYKTIEVFNPAAQRIFGFAETEIVGKNVSMLMPASIAELHDNYVDTYLTNHVAHIIGRSREVQAKKKDGTLFPIVLNVVEGHVNGQSFFAGYVRDQTEVRNYETMLVQEKQKSEELLHALLPAMVAEQLKEHSMRSLQQSKTLIAEGYAQLLAHSYTHPRTHTTPH
eukprot:TRINITY_DN10134_c0_g2_i1.p1 TRINITY_DN10134_c0_g2~~TRINITY_DN10134_c0_g2_i1.p1  ORF type:complete len:1502 (-),score=473.50 TRINITY_DN10134_c0_g2_i1:59-4564(-)